MQIIIISELRNIAPRFSGAIWRKYEVGKFYPSAKEANKFHKLKNCHYKYVKRDSCGSEITVREINHSKLDSYGNRVN